MTQLKMIYDAVAYPRPLLPEVPEGFVLRTLSLEKDTENYLKLRLESGFSEWTPERLAALCVKACPNGVRVVEHLEKDGAGLNLTKQVRDGMLNHRMIRMPATVEGRIVRISDKIAYINHDIDDSLRAGIFREKDIPAVYTDVLGHSIRERLNTLIRDVIENSRDCPEIRMSGGMFETMMSLRKWLFVNVYLNPVPKAEERKAEEMIRQLYEYYKKRPEQMPEEYRFYMEQLGQPLERTVCDFIAGMSDQYAIRTFEEIFVPRSWTVY